MAGGRPTALREMSGGDDAAVTARMVYEAAAAGDALARQIADDTARARGRTTVPQIFIGATHVGGCDDLYALDSEGKLDPLLNGQGPA